VARKREGVVPGREKGRFVLSRTENLFDRLSRVLSNFFKRERREDCFSVEVFVLDLKRVRFRV